MKADIIGKITLLVSKPELMSESEVSYLMSLTRKYLEYPNEKLKGRFSTLKFFCDWALHISIDRSIPALETLVKLNDVIVELKKTPNNDLLMQRVTKIVSFPLLKTEFHKFFLVLGVKDELTTDTYKWVKFLEKFIEIILDCVLILPDPPQSRRVKPYYDRIVSNPVKEGFWTIGLSISKVNESYFKAVKILSPNSLLCLILYSSDTTRIVIPLTKSEILK